jgi:hypothetical protein
LASTVNFQGDEIDREALASRFGRNLLDAAIGKLANGTTIAADDEARVAVLVAVI